MYSMLFRLAWCRVLQIQSHMKFCAHYEYIQLIISVCPGYQGVHPRISVSYIF